MTNLLDDAPKRTMFAKTQNNDSKVFFITDLDIFLRRDKEMKVKQEVSSAVIGRLHEKHPGAAYACAITPEQSSHPAAIVGAHNLENFYRFYINPHQLGDTMLGLIQFLKDLNVHFMTIHRPRTVSYLNIEKFVRSPNFIKIGGSDYAKLGIEPDKDMSFQDYAKQRRKDAWP